MPYLFIYFNPYSTRLFPVWLTTSTTGLFKSFNNNQNTKSRARQLNSLSCLEQKTNFVRGSAQRVWFCSDNTSLSQIVWNVLFCECRLCTLLIFSIWALISSLPTKKRWAQNSRESGLWRQTLPPRERKIHSLQIDAKVEVALHKQSAVGGKYQLQFWGLHVREIVLLMPFLPAV